MYVWILGERAGDEEKKKISCVSIDHDLIHLVWSRSRLVMSYVLTANKLSTTIVISVVTARIFSLWQRIGTKSPED